MRSSASSTNFGRFSSRALKINQVSETLGKLRNQLGHINRLACFENLSQAHFNQFVYFGVQISHHDLL